MEHTEAELQDSFAWSYLGFSGVCRHYLTASCYYLMVACVSVLCEDQKSVLVELVGCVSSYSSFCLVGFFCFVGT